MRRELLNGKRILKRDVRNNGLLMPQRKRGRIYKVWMERVVREAHRIRKREDEEEEERRKKKGKGPCSTQ